jgi:hypothetical protein
MLRLYLSRCYKIIKNNQTVSKGCWEPASLSITARQYGEVVSPPSAGWRTFCRHGTSFIECWRDRGTILVGVANLSPITKLLADTGAVSRYKLSRNQKFITVQEFNCGQMSVSGCNDHYKSVLGAEVKAKSVTNNLPILSVLAAAIIFFNLFCIL